MSLSLDSGFLCACSAGHIMCEKTKQWNRYSGDHSRQASKPPGRLPEIPGEFPANDLYNYAYVLKYQVLEVHRGKVDSKEIFVAHYNPLKPRSGVQDEVSGKVGGNLNDVQGGRDSSDGTGGAAGPALDGVESSTSILASRVSAIGPCGQKLAENIQQAIEAPRWSTRSFPASQFPHTMYPGEMTVEERFLSRFERLSKERVIA